MKKNCFSLIACLVISASSFAANDGKIANPKLNSETSDLKTTFFSCVGDINVVDSRGNRIKSFTFNNPNATSHRDCLQSYANAVAEIEASLTEGQTTSGAVIYL